MYEFRKFLSMATIVDDQIHDWWQFGNVAGDSDVGDFMMVTD